MKIFFLFLFLEPVHVRGNKFKRGNSISRSKVLAYNNTRLDPVFATDFGIKYSILITQCKHAAKLGLDCPCKYLFFFYTKIMEVSINVLYSVFYCIG